MIWKSKQYTVDLLPVVEGRASWQDVIKFGLSSLMQPHPVSWSLEYMFLLFNIPSGYFVLVLGDVPSVRFSKSIFMVPASSLSPCQCSMKKRMSPLGVRHSRTSIPCPWVCLGRVPTIVAAVMKRKRAAKGEVFMVCNLL